MGFMVPCALVRINFEITRSILKCNYILMGSASSIDLDVIIYSSVIISYEMEFCLQCTKRSLTGVSRASLLVTQGGIALSLNVSLYVIFNCIYMTKCLQCSSSSLSGQHGQ